MPAPLRLALAAGLAALAHSAADAQTLSRVRPVATYSIVARDSATGQLGVAVQSHWFSVGPIVPWAEAGVGAVATQSFVDPRYGPLGLELMRLGRSAPEALRALVSSDADSAVRQVAMVDAQGRVEAWTGGRAVAAAGHRVGRGYSVQANLMDRPTVWPAMARAYETAQGDLAERLLAALEAAEREGGDIRGRQSAAIVVVAAEGTGRPWVDRIVDLRVEDHPDPVAELRRLVTLARAYRKLNEGDEWVTRGDLPRAVEAYGAALAIVPDAATNGEAAFWTGISLAGAGQVEQAIPYLRRAYAVHPRWAELVGRLPAAGLLPSDPALVERLVREMQRR
ncbi:MAG TPA: DUF1028 domain-containing protein [Longimicrobium sp.]|nr:DUF1028 domain-containing protein [Longimicrobium sp.]